MICLALGLGLLGAVAFRKARRCRGYYGHHYGHWYGGWQGHHHARHGRRGLYFAFEHLDASPAQERAIIAEVDRLTDRVHAAKHGLRDGRADLAAAVRGDALDEAALGAVLGRVDGATTEVRSAILDALRNIHAVLDHNQRERLADILDRGWRMRGAGPYRV